MLRACAAATNCKAHVVDVAVALIVVAAGQVKCATLWRKTLRQTLCIHTSTHIHTHPNTHSICLHFNCRLSPVLKRKIANNSSSVVAAATAATKTPNATTAIHFLRIYPTHFTLLTALSEGVLNIFLWLSLRLLHNFFSSVFSFWFKFWFWFAARAALTFYGY